MLALLVAFFTLICLAISFGINYWIMTAGWGLTVQSWPVVLAGTALSSILIIVQGLLAAFKE